MRFVLLADYKDEVFEVRLDPDAANGLLDYYGSLVSAYSALEPIEYEPGYKPSSEEVLRLAYQLPARLTQFEGAVPGRTKQLRDERLRVGLPRALIGVLYAEKSTHYAFQAVDPRNAIGLKKGALGVIFWGGDNFTLIRDPGMIPGKRLDAVFENGNLFFRSDYVVSRFLDMEEYFREATDEDLEEVFEASHFVVDDWNALRNVAGVTVRRKIARLVAVGRAYDSGLLKKAARKAKVALAITNGRINVPTNKKGLRELVDLLDDAYLRSLIDESRCYVTNSKRLVK